MAPRTVIVHTQEPYNAEPDREALAGAALTPAETFYIRNHGPVPATYSGLRIEGLVDNPASLQLQDLLRYERRELTATLQCAGNRRAGLIEVRDIPGEAPWGPGATGTARWAGVSLADVLASAGVQEAAAHVAFVSTDHAEEAGEDYGASIPLGKALQREVLLAWEMNGHVLPAMHGGPLRVIVPGYIGARSVKWVSRIEVLAEPFDGHFQSVAYRLLAPGEEPGKGVGVPLGEVALNSDILRIADGVVEGYAFAGGERHVTRVEVSSDGGETWAPAELLEDLGPWAWRLWRARVDPGAREIVARAWDSAAATQPEHAASVWNPKGYVNNSWARVRL